MLSKINNELTRQITFERLVSSIAKDFIQNKNIKNSIVNALQQIGETSRANRAYVSEFDTDQALMSNTFEWCCESTSA